MRLFHLLFPSLVYGDSRIKASAKFDPGLRDTFKAHARELLEFGDESMVNKEVYPNDENAPGAHGVPLTRATHPDHPAIDHLVDLKASWTLAQRKRNYVLIVEDMENGFGYIQPNFRYKDFVDYVVPNLAPLVALFRKLKLPIIWTNWVRRHDDGYYGAVDRFYGPRGIREETNPCYIYGDNASRTVEELKPINEEEYSRLIESLHLNKFADLDEEGREILYPMLKAWGVDTIILTGAWTDDCIASTAFDAVDRYGYDLVVVSDGVATASIHGNKAVDVMCVGVAKCMAANEVLNQMEQMDPKLIDTPKDKLRGEVYKKFATASTHKLEL